jgi:hypothetical protein
MKRSFTESIFSQVETAALFPPIRLGARKPRGVVALENRLRVGTIHNAAYAVVDSNLVKAC